MTDRDPVVESVVADLRQRSEFGIQKYGSMLTRPDYKLVDWLKDAYTEALDMANYLKAAITKLELEAQEAST